MAKEQPHYKPFAVLIRELAAFGVTRAEYVPPDTTPPPAGRYVTRPTDQIQIGLWFKEGTDQTLISQAEAAVVAAPLLLGEKEFAPSDLVRQVRRMTPEARDRLIIRAVVDWARGNKEWCINALGMTFRGKGLL